MPTDGALDGLEWDSDYVPEASGNSPAGANNEGGVYLRTTIPEVPGPVIGLSNLPPDPPVVGDEPQFSTYLSGLTGVRVSGVTPDVYGGPSFVSDRFITLSGDDLASGAVGPYDFLAQSTYTLLGPMPGATNQPFGLIQASSQDWSGGIGPGKPIGIAYLAGTFTLPTGYTLAGEVFSALKYADLVVKMPPGASGYLGPSSQLYGVNGSFTFDVTPSRFFLDSLTATVGDPGQTILNSYLTLRSLASNSPVTNSYGFVISAMPLGQTLTLGFVSQYPQASGMIAVGDWTWGGGAPSPVFGLDLQGPSNYGAIGMAASASDLSTVPAPGNAAVHLLIGATSAHHFLLITYNLSGTIQYFSLDLTGGASSQWVFSTTLPT